MSDRLHDEIVEVLTETRVILPGAQALLGFQFATVLTQRFAALDDGARAVHLVCLALVALATVILMTPAAHHRTVEKGDATERFRVLASRLIVVAMVTLALGIAGDVYVVAVAAHLRPLAGVVGAAFVVSVCAAFWIVVPLVARRRLHA